MYLGQIGAGVVNVHSLDDMTRPLPSVETIFGMEIWLCINFPLGMAFILIVIYGLSLLWGGRGGLSWFDVNRYDITSSLETAQ